MSTTLTKVVLVGASGTVGSHILKAILEDPIDDFQVTVLVRPDSTSQIADHNAVNVVRTDFSNIAVLASTFAGHDAIIHAGSISSLPSQKVMIEAAAQAGVHRFILNEFANSPINQIGLPELEPFRKIKKEILAFAKTKSVEVPGFTWSALATGNFLDYSLKKFPQFGIDIRNRKARLVDDGMEPFTAVTLMDIARAVRGILRRPLETKDRFLHIRSVQTCQKQIVNALEDSTGEKWELEYVDSSMLYMKGKEAFAKGEKAGMIDLLVVQLFKRGGNRSIVVKKEQSDNELLGVVEVDILEVVRDVLKTS